MPFGILELGLQIMLAIHAARTGRLQPWLYIILFLPGIGMLLYVVVELLPEYLSGRRGARLRSGALNIVAPTRHYRALAREVEIAPTVYNKSQLAAECLDLGRSEEAAGLYETCLTGLAAHDPGLRIGLARAQVALGQYPSAIATLEALANDTPQARTPEGHLLYAQALDGAGRTQDALDQLQTLVEYFPGEEARSRYADLLARTGATERARAQYREIIRRVELQGGPYRRAQRSWYDLARKAVA